MKNSLRIVQITPLIHLPTCWMFEFRAQVPSEKCSRTQLKDFSRRTCKASLFYCNILSEICATYVKRCSRITWATPIMRLAIQWLRAQLRWGRVSENCAAQFLDIRKLRGIQNLRPTCPADSKTYDDNKLHVGLSREASSALGLHMYFRVDQLPSRLDEIPRFSPLANSILGLLWVIAVCELLGTLTTTIPPWNSLPFSCFLLFNFYYNTPPAAWFFILVG